MVEGVAVDGVVAVREATEIVIGVEVVGDGINIKHLDLIGQSMQVRR